MKRSPSCAACRAAVDAFKADLGSHLKDHPMELTRGVPEMIEVLPPGISKAVGLKALLKDLSISAEEVSGAPGGKQRRKGMGSWGAMSVRTRLALRVEVD